MRVRDNLIPGSARVSRAGFGVSQNELLLGFDYFERLDAEAKPAIARTRSPTRRTRALPGINCLRRSLRFSLPGASLQSRPGVFPIKFGNETGADFRRAHCFAFVGVRAIAETFCVHLPHHSCHPRGPFWRALR